MGLAILKARKRLFFSSSAHPSYFAMLTYAVICTLMFLMELLQSSIAKRHSGPQKLNSCLRIATHNNPLAGVPNLPSGNLGLIEKDLLDLLSEKLNFTYEIVVPTDVRQLGTLQPNGSWIGTLGLLARREADASISFGIRNWNRHRSFDLTSAILTDNIGILVPYPTIGINSTALFDIYTPLIWFLILLSTSATIVYLWAVGMLKPSERTEFSILALYITGVLVGQQGGWLKPQSEAFRFVFGLWLLGLLVITYGYTGTLISRTSAPSINYVAESLDDIASSNQIKPYTIKGSATHAEFQESKLSSFTTVNEKFNDELLLSSSEGIVEIIAASKQPSVFFFSDIVIENEIKKDFIKTGQCRAFLLKEKVLVRRNGLFLNKDSPYTHAFDQQVLLLRQHGLGKYLEVKYKTYTTGKCSINEQEIRKREYNGPLGLYHIKGAFYLLGIGAFLSLVVFIAENVYFRYSLKQRAKC